MAYYSTVYTTPVSLLCCSCAAILCYCAATVLLQTLCYMLRRVAAHQACCAEKDALA